MFSFLKWWGIAAMALLVVTLCSQGAILLIEWIDTLPVFWQATIWFTLSSIIAGSIMKAMFGRG